LADSGWKKANISSDFTPWSNAAVLEEWADLVAVF
jgi:hypothetical protein